MEGENYSAEHMAQAYLEHVFGKRADNQYIRYVAPWLGLFILGVESIKDRWWVSRTKQLCFEFDGRQFKARYNPDLKPHGAIEIVELEAAPGRRDKGVAKVISSLKDAAKFFRTPKL
jgi:hypothetical protein